MSILPVASIGTVRPHSAVELAHAKKDFFIAGMKNYGRAPTFLLATGHEQVRSVAAMLAGDSKAAKRVELDLPETGVCNTRPPRTPNSRLPPVRPAAAGRPPVEAVAACCADDVKVQAAGKGESCRAPKPTPVAVSGAPQMDFVFTVCDQAVSEACPVWPGQPVTAHWGLPDPAAVEGSDIDKAQAFRDTLRALENRLKLFVALPVASLDRIALTRQINAIGRMRPDAAEEEAS